MAFPNEIQALASSVPAQWQDLDNFYLSRPWLAFADSDKISAPCYLSRPELSLVAHFSPSENNPDYVPGLIFGGRRGYHSSLPQSCSVMDGMRELATTLGAGFDQWTWPYLTKDDAVRLTQLARATHSDAQLSAGLQGGECYLNVPSGGFLELVAELPTKQRRTNIRAELRKLDCYQDRVRVVPFAEFEDDIAQLGLLLSNVQQKYGHQHSADMMTTMLSRQYAFLGDDGVLFLMYADDAHNELIGFHLAYKHGGKLWSRVVGFDYPRTADLPAYTKVVFEMPAEYCAANGLDSIELGMGSFEAKIRRGAQFRPLYHVSCGTPAVRTMKPEDLKQRLPLREQALVENVELPD